MSEREREPLYFQFSIEARARGVQHTPAWSESVRVACAAVQAHIRWGNFINAGNCGIEDRAVRARMSVYTRHRDE